jgi:hypothetical protein
MGHEFLPPEWSVSWDELGDQAGAADHAHPESLAWRIVAALAFVNGLVLSAYAFQDGYWWLWVSALVAFAIVGAMASRAVSNMIREGEIDPMSMGREHFFRDNAS